MKRSSKGCLKSKDPSFSTEMCLCRIRMYFSRWAANLQPCIKSQWKRHQDQWAHNSRSPNLISEALIIIIRRESYAEWETLPTAGFPTKRSFSQWCANMNSIAKVNSRSISSNLSKNTSTSCMKNWNKSFQNVKSLIKFWKRISSLIKSSTFRLRPLQGEEDSLLTSQLSDLAK